MIVIDASALVSALTDDGDKGDSVRKRLSEDIEWHAPEHLRIEVLSAIRGRCLGGKITPERGAAAVATLKALELVSHSCDGLADRIWELRDNFTAYDAAYIAVAEAQKCPLVTCDYKLKGQGVARCVIDVVS